MYNYYFKELPTPEEILVYLRKSRADDPLLTVAEVLSKHKSILDEWVEKNLPTPIPEKNYFKEVISGGDSIADRPEFQKLLKLIESPSYKAVLVLDVDRLGRPDTEEIGRLTKIFRYTDTLVITPMMIFDLTNDYQRDGFERELKRGQEELERTKIRLSRGRELSVKSGNYVCSKPPYGYDKITINDGKRKCPTLAINDEQANIVRMIFNAYVNENIGARVIANRLNDLQIKSPSGKVWESEAINDIIENPVYIGMVRWNERKAVLVVDNGEFRKTRPKTTNGEAILCKGKHEPIISEELFQAAQEKRGRVHRTCNNKELRNPLASLIYCECGRAMVYRHSTRKGGEPKGEPRLVCGAQHRCGNGSCSVNELVDFTQELLKQKIEEFEIESKRIDDNSNKIQEKLIKGFEKKLTDIDAKELSLWESQLEVDTKMPPHIFQSLTTKLKKEREETQAALEKARKELSTPINYEKKRITFQNALDGLLDDEMSVAEKNRLLKECIDRITYQRDIPQRKLGKGSGKGYVYPPMKLDVKLNI